MALHPHDQQMRESHNSLKEIFIVTVAYIVTCPFSHYFNSYVHTRVAGSGFHLPSALHTALILPAGTNPGLHLKNISAPSVVFWYASMKPFLATLGSPQLTGESRLMKVIYGCSA